LDAATSSPNDLPATGTSALMTGGNDGLSGLVDADFTGSATSKTGVYGFDLVAEQALLFAANRTTATVANALLAYCQDVKKNFWFTILGCPANQSASQIVTYVNTLTASDRGALYWPRVKVDNPSTAVFGSAKTITCDNAGWVAGVWSRVHNARLGGVYDAPAGELGAFRTVKAYDNDDCLEESKRDIVYPKRVNPFNNEFGLNIDGSYTLKSTGNWPTVAGRVGTDFIQATIHNGLKIAKHKAINTTLMARVRRTVKRFLDDQLPLGAFRSKDPNQAFYVKVEEVTTDADIDAGILNVEFGLNRASEAQFVIATVRKFVPAA
jgi:phage tail sheath protein FI